MNFLVSRMLNQKKFKAKESFLVLTFNSHLETDSFRKSKRHKFKLKNKVNRAHRIVSVLEFRSNDKYNLFKRNKLCETRW